MPFPSPSSAPDKISFIRKGMNSGIKPRLLSADELALAVNLTMRGGFPRTRPVLRKVPLVYENEDTKANATAALFQGASFHQAYQSGENSIVSSIGGRLFRYTVGSNNKVTDISISGDLNAPNLPQAWMWQAEDFLIIQNGSQYPLFFDGASVRRSLGPPGRELPAGAMGAFVQRRVWMVRPDRQSFLAGDLVYSQGFGGPYNGRDAVLKTNDNQFLLAGGSFTVPLTAGNINAVANIAISDTSLGQGPVMILTQNSVFSVHVSLDAAEWTTTQFPVMNIGLPGYGAMGQDSTTLVNGDLWYRSLDGIRSYMIAKRDFESSWVNTPLSDEMEIILKSDTDHLLEYGSATVFDNRLIMTCSPYRVTDRGVPHRGFIALDFHNISGINQEDDPAYDGLWTGLPALKIVKGTFNKSERCFVFALDGDNKICLYELFKDGIGRFDYNGIEDVGVESVFESRSLMFGFGGDRVLKLSVADLFLDKLLGPGDGELSFLLKYKPDQFPVWQDWHNWTLCAKAEDCDRETCDPLQNIWPHYWTFMRVAPPSDNVPNNVTKRPMPTGYEFQVRLKWSGYAELNRLITWTNPMPETTESIYPTPATCTLLTGCDEDLFTYSIE